MTETIFFDCDEDRDELTHGDIGSAVDYYLDDLPPDLWPARVKVYAWKSVKVPPTCLDGRLVELALELLDQDFGGDDASDPTPAMMEAEAALIRAILADYTPWRCDRSPADDDEVEVASWVREFSPEWLDDPAVLSALARLEAEADRVQP